MLLKITTINSEDGLPNEQIHAVDQDHLGRLWMASPTGLSRYNGSQIKIFGNNSELDCIGLRTVRIDADEKVWVGTDRGLEVINLAGKKKHWTNQLDWQFGIAESILCLDAVVWVGTSFGLLKLQEEKENNELQITYKEELGLVRSIIQKDESNLLVASTQYGLIEHNGTNWKKLNEDVLPNGDAIICMAITKTKDILVGTTNGLFVLDEEGMLKQHFTLSMQQNKVSAIAIADDEWWIGMGHSLILAKWINNEIKIVEAENLNTTINELFVDKKNNVWIATNNLGLKKVSCLRKALYQIDCGKEAAAFSIKRLQSKNLLHIGGDGFFINVSPTAEINQHDVYENFHALHGIVWDTSLDPIDHTLVWIATDDGLFFSKKNAAPERYSDPNKIITSPNRVLLTRGDEVWLGTIGGLYKIKNSIAEEVFAADGSRFGYVYTLSLDQHNKLWVGTLGKGLWIESENGLVPFTNELLTPFGNTYAISKNEAHQTLVIQEDRLLIVDENLETHLVLSENPVAGWTAIWINKTTIATGSNNGVLLVDAETCKVIQRINPILGKSAWQFTSTRSLFFDGVNKLYCAINQGLFVVDIKKFNAYLPPPTIYCENVDWQNVSPKLTDSVYDLSPGKWSVAVSVFTNWLVDDDQIQFRFKLVGFEETWSGLSDLPLIKYNSLPIGRYDVQCQVYSPLTGFSSPQKVLTLNVASNIWRIGLSSVTNLFSSVNERFYRAKLRNKILRERNVELESEVNERKRIENALLSSREGLRELASRQEKIREEERLRMSREIHDELGQLLTGIKLSIAWLKRKALPAEKNVEEKYEETLQMADEIAKAVRRISTELRPPILDSFGIVAALEWQTKEFEKRNEISIDFFTNCPDLELDPDTSIVLFRIFQETLTNVSKYAEAKLVNASVEMENEKIVMRIRDDGKGFLATEVVNKETLGILGMRERALTIGADYIINSSPGKGTSTEVIFPLHKN